MKVFKINSIVVLTTVARNAYSKMPQTVENVQLSQYAEYIVLDSCYIKSNDSDIFVEILNPLNNLKYSVPYYELNNKKL